MIGISTADLISTIRTKGAELKKKSRGGYLKYATLVVEQLKIKGFITASEQKLLVASYKDLAALTISTRNASRIALLSRKRFDDYIYAGQTTEVARTLAELQNDLIKNFSSYLPPNSGSNRQNTRATSVSTTVPGGSAANIALWAAMGALIGGSIGGGLGAVIGGLIGAAIGACGGDTEVTVTSGSGTPT